MMQLLHDIKAVMLYKKVSTQKLAELIHKDPTTIARQLDPEKGNPQLVSIVQIVDALGARLVVETEESVKAIQESNVTAYRDRITEMGAEIARLREKLEDRDARIARRDKIIEEQKEVIARQDHIIDVKEADIHRKDAVIAQHIKKQEELYEKLMKKG